MNPLLQPEVQQFIHDHENEDVKAFVLKNQSVHGVSPLLIAQQIAGRRKIKDKAPLFYNTSELIYPPTLNIEQCSSAATALFKAQLMHGESAADLTGGFGVDSFFLSKQFKKVTYIEPDPSVFEIAKHNLHTLGANVNCVRSKAEDFLASTKQHFDLVYLDPSRRDHSQKKVFKFSSCVPDVIQLLPLLQAHADKILIKASPLLDIKQGLRELNLIADAYVVAVDNECKELLYYIEANSKREGMVTAVDLSKTGVIENSFAFTLEEEKNAEVQFSDPLNYMYEPSAALLKAGAFRLLCKKFKVNKLSPSTHLYTSNTLVEAFPGKIFQLEEFVKAESRDIRKFLPEMKANVTTRNYPLSPEQLKKKLKINDGGEKYLIGFSGTQKKFLTLAKRLT